MKTLVQKYSVHEDLPQLWLADRQTEGDEWEPSAAERLLR